MAKDNGANALYSKQVFTTGEAAEVCKVSQQTIIRCFDSGRLHGFRVPGSRFRRIPRAELIRFMKDNDIPTACLEGEEKRVLIVDDDPEIVGLLEELLKNDDRFEIKTAATGYDAGLLTESFKPHVLLLDYMLPDINGNLVCERIKANPEFEETRVIVISGVVPQEDIDSLFESGADAFIKKPFNVEDIIKKIDELVSE